MSEPEALTTEPPSSRPGRLAGIPYRWVAMGVVLFGAFMVVLDTTIVNLGLSSLQRDFGTLHGVEWVVTAYLIAVGVTQLTSGWVGDRFGRRRAFITALVLFTLASMLCSIAPTLPMLVGARVLQGVGGGLLIPVAMAMIFELFEPAERGRALGYFGIAVMAAPAIGPVLGGLVVSSVGWRWLFLINVPVGLIGIPVAMSLLRDTGYREKRPFDLTGLCTAGAGLVAVLVGLQQGGEWGWTSPAVIALLAGGALLLVAFTLHSLHHDAPLVEMRLFATPVFAVSIGALCLMTVAQYGRLVYTPLELGSTRDINELRIGLVMMPAALGVAVMMPLGGRLTDRFGSRLPYTLGAAIMAVSYWGLAHLTADTNLVWISLALLCGGFGAGIGSMSPNVTAMNSVSASYVGQASGLSSVTRQVAAAFGTAVLASIFASTAPDTADLTDPSVVGDAVDAFNTVFAAVIVVLLVAIVVGLFLPGRRRAHELQQERLEERERLVAEGLLLDASAAEASFAE